MFEHLAIYMYTYNYICSDVTTEEVNEAVGPEEESFIQDLVCNLDENVATSGKNL